MKKAVIFLAFILLAFTPEKKYTVSLTVTEWQNYINVIEYTKNTLKQSNAPVNIVLPVCDSLTKMENEFLMQVQPQIKDEKK